MAGQRNSFLASGQRPEALQSTLPSIPAIFRSSSPCLKGEEGCTEKQPFPRTRASMWSICWTLRLTSTNTYGSMRGENTCLTPPGSHCHTRRSVPCLSAAPCPRLLFLRPCLLVPALSVQLAAGWGVGGWGGRRDILQSTSGIVYIDRQWEFARPCHQPDLACGTPPLVHCAISGGGEGRRGGGGQAGRRAGGQAGRRAEGKDGGGGGAVHWA